MCPIAYWDTPPWDQRQTCPPVRHSPVQTPTGQTLPPGRDPQADTSRLTPPRQTHTPAQTPPISSPCLVHAWRYGQQAGGTHPTGMHSLCFYLQRRGGHGCSQTCQCKYSKDGVKLKIFEEQGFGPIDVNYHCCTCVETRCNCGNAFADIPGQNYKVRDFCLVVVHVLITTTSKPEILNVTITVLHHHQSAFLPELESL